MKQRKTEILMIIILLLIQCSLYIFVGVQKSYIHMDEAYSLGLASYDKVEIQHNDDFYDKWHSKEYYEDYLSLQDDEKGSFYQVYENQKNDVHPPLYYLFLRLGMEFDGGHYNKWPGITINIIIYIFITILMYLISKRVLDGQNNCNIKAGIVSFFSSITLAALTNVAYIRMYALLTLFIVLTAYLHIKLWENRNSTKTILLIGLTALLGSLTHYYYLFFLAAIFIMFTIKFIKEKDYKVLAKYICTIIFAGILSIIIFPHSIQHMFFGYRGKGFMSKLMDIESYLNNISVYLNVVIRYVFHYAIIFAAIIFYIIYKFRKNNKLAGFNNPNIEVTKIIFIPTLFYFIMVALASPWLDLRYMMPVCGLIFLLVIYYMYLWMKTVLDERKLNTLFAAFLIAMLILPSVFRMEPQVAYTQKKDIVNTLEKDLNVPTIFVFNSSNNRFLDDILLFSKIDESYIAKDLNCTEQNIQDIFKDKDISKGVVVFINDGQEDDEILSVIQKALSLDKSQYLERLNACNVYCIK